MPSTDNAALIPVSSETLFKGREGDTRLGEWVSTADPSKIKFEKKQVPIFLFGCPDDTGVRLNLGRPGAHEGPLEIRRAFYKMTLPMDGSWDSLLLFDCGNIDVSKNIEQTHKNAFQASETLSKLGGTLILLGGGHDFAAPGFLGFASGQKQLMRTPRFGLINLDPHLDVRELPAGKPHSGTPFRQILNSQVIAGEDFIQFGCRENRNASPHFDFCKEMGVNLQPLEWLRRQSKSVPELFKQNLNRMSQRVDSIGITIDIDSCADLIGSSAAPAIGFSIKELYDTAYLAGTCSQVRYFELAEVAPSLDPSGKTSLAASEILYAFLCGKTAAIKTKSGFGLNRKSHKTLKKRKNR